MFVAAIPGFIESSHRTWAIRSTPMAWACQLLPKVSRVRSKPIQAQRGSNPFLFGRRTHATQVAMRLRLQPSRCLFQMGTRWILNRHFLRISPRTCRLEIIDAYHPFAASEETELANFERAGGGLYLTGERICCTAQNQTDQDLLNSLLKNANLNLTSISDPVGSDPQAINPGTIDGLATSPNKLTTWTPSATGGIIGVSGNNAFISSPAGVVLGAAWDGSSTTSGTGGRIVILMDIKLAPAGFRGSQYSAADNAEYCALPTGLRATGCRKTLQTKTRSGCGQHLSAAALCCHPPSPNERVCRSRPTPTVRWTDK